MTNNTARKPASGELTEAVMRGNVKAVKELLRRGANADEEDKKSGCCMLRLAAMFGHTEIARLLIDNGANVNKETGSGERPLMAAARCGSMDIARLLIDNGAEVNATTVPYGWTPLMIAVDYDKIDIMRLLIDSGADISMRNCEGATAQSIAINRKQTEMTAVLQTEMTTLLDLASRAATHRAEEAQARSAAAQAHARAVEKQKFLKSRIPKVIIRGLQS